MSPHELCVPVLQHLELQAEESESGGGEDVPGQDADTLPGTDTAAADTLIWNFHHLHCSLHTDTQIISTNPSSRDGL